MHDRKDDRSQAWGIEKKERGGHGIGHPKGISSEGGHPVSHQGAQKGCYFFFFVVAFFLVVFFAAFFGAAFFGAAFFFVVFFFAVAMAFYPPSNSKM